MGREGSSLFGWEVELTHANYELGRLRVSIACTKFRWSEFYSLVNSRCAWPLHISI